MVWLVAGSSAPVIGTEPPAEPVLDRGLVVLRLDCAGGLGRKELTLFADGTVRRRRWQASGGGEFSDLGRGRRTAAEPGALELDLGELEPEILAATLARLRAENLSESEERAGEAIAGEWIETCKLELELAGRAKKELSFGRYDSLSLATSRVVKIAEELEAELEEGLEIEPAFPDGWEPRLGDVLEREDGTRFEVMSFTDDGRGVELAGLDEPLTLYVSREDLTMVFLSLVVPGR